MRTRCARHARGIALLAGEELGRRRSARVIRHAASCPGCARLLEELGQARRLARKELGELAETEAFHSVRTAVRARLTAEERRGTPWGLPLWSAAAPIAGVVAAAAFLLLGGRERPARLPEVAEIGSSPEIVLSPPEDGRVVLTIRTQTERPYRVAVSRRSWDFRDAPVYEVRHGEWVDSTPDPEVGQAVFYKVD